MKTLVNPREEIRPLLMKVRRQMLKLAKSNDCIGKENLSGWCILTSYVLFHILKRRGYHPEVCKNWGHAFIVCDGWYIDVTCTQFNNDYHKKNGTVFPQVYCQKAPAHKEVHQITGRTCIDEDIWGNLCRGWCQPVKLDNPVIRDMVTNWS